MFFAHCGTLYPFSREWHGQELCFAVGGLIMLQQVLDGGCWKDKKEYRLRGWFPASYMHLLEKPGMVPTPPGSPC